MLRAMKSLIPLLCAVCVSLDFAQAKPNLVFIIADDLTFRDIGCYGGQSAHAEYRLSGDRRDAFRRCFQSSSMCSPTRHNIYTGLYPFNSEAYPNHTFAKLGTKSVVQYLKPPRLPGGCRAKRISNPSRCSRLNTAGETIIRIWKRSIG